MRGADPADALHGRAGNARAGVHLADAGRPLRGPKNGSENLRDEMRRVQRKAPASRAWRWRAQRRRARTGGATAAARADRGKVAFCTSGTPTATMIPTTPTLATVSSRVVPPSQSRLLEKGCRRPSMASLHQGPLCRLDRELLARVGLVVQVSSCLGLAGPLGPAHAKPTMAADRAGWRGAQNEPRQTC